MAKENKETIICTAIGAAVLGCTVAIQEYWCDAQALLVVLYLTAYLLVGFPVAGKIWRNIENRKKLLDENILIMIATLGAFCIERYLEGVAVILFFQVGIILEEMALNRSKRSIASLINLSSPYANRIKDGKEKRIDSNDLRIDDTIVIKPGERVPVDGEIKSGATTLDTQAITGEAIPQEVNAGELIYSGSINLTGVIEMRVSKTCNDSTVSKIAKLVEAAEERKAESEKFITKFARYYTPLIVCCAVLISVIPPLTFAKGQWNDWVYRGMIFLVVACPCALVMSIPIAFFGGIGIAAKRGILVKGGNFLEALAKADTFVFDKTGTLTTGEFEVRDVKTFGLQVSKLLEIAAHVESYSNHPISLSLQEAYGKELQKDRVKNVKELPGYGIYATFDGDDVYLGNAKLMRRRQAEFKPADVSGSIVYVLVNGVYKGYINITDILKEDAADTMHYLKNKCNATLVMMTGDSKKAGGEYAAVLGMDYVHTNMLPEEKLAYLEELLELQMEQEKLIFVGDGINDAPVLARADVGIAMGALGSDAAIEAADIVLMDDEPYHIVEAVKIARETLKVVKQNIKFALLVKVVVLIFSTFGFLTMWDAIFIDVAVMLLVMLNAVWVSRYPV